VLFDFVDELGAERAQVFDSAGDGLAPCAWTASARVSSGALPSPPTFPARRFQCAGGEHYFVGETVIDDEAYRARRCIWAHPTPNGELRIRFSAVPIGRVVRGYGMLPWLIMRDLTGAPVELRVRVDGDPIGTFVHHGGEGWKHFEFATGSRAGTTADVEFAISADDVHNRHFCFQADTR
jgi:hypothetical protein